MAGYIRRFERKLNYNPRNGQYSLTIPLKLVQALQTFGGGRPYNVTITLLADEANKPRIVLSDIGFVSEAITPPEPRAKKPWEASGMYSTWGASHGRRPTNSNGPEERRYGNRLFTKAEAEEQGLKWDE